jgi:hypothetical protein
MLGDKIIQPIQSPSNFPILLVPKNFDAAGKHIWQICIDFWKLNYVNVGDSFPLPNIQDVLDKLGRARYVSAFDCANGYWQITLAEEERIKTVI